jgi:hypothetical protein
VRATSGSCDVTMRETAQLGGRSRLETAEIIGILIGGSTASKGVGRRQGAPEDSKAEGLSNASK